MLVKQNLKKKELIRIKKSYIYLALYETSFVAQVCSKFIYIDKGFI